MIRCLDDDQYQAAYAEWQRAGGPAPAVTAVPEPRPGRMVSPDRLRDSTDLVIAVLSQFPRSRHCARC
jgi:hypothetical protein